MNTSFPRLQLLKQKNFQLYLVSCMIATFGNGLSYVANSWFILSTDNSISAIALLMISFWLPMLLIGPIGGVLADKYHPKKMLIYTNLIRAFCLLIFAASYIEGLNGHYLYLQSVIIGTCFSLYLPAASVYIRRLVIQDHMLYANSLLDIIYEIGMMTGIGLAGILIAYFGASSAYALTGILFILSSLVLVFVNPIITSEQASSEITKSRSFIANLQAGFWYIKQRPLLKTIYTMQLLIFVNALIAPVILAPFVKNILHANVLEFGLIETALSIGIIIGGILSPNLVVRYSFKWVLLAETTALTFCFISFVFIYQIILAGVLYFIMGFAFSVWPLMVTKAQELTDIEYQGRVQATFSSFASASIIILYLMITFLGSYAPINTMYIFEAAISLLATWIVWKTRKFL